MVAAFQKFREQAEPLLIELEKTFEEANTAYQQCVEQYGEDPSKKEPGEFFKVFEDFISKIIEIVTKIDQAKEKEEKAKQRELAKKNAGPQTRYKYKHKFYFLNDTFISLIFIILD